jgi:hypothetical protein
MNEDLSAVSRMRPSSTTVMEEPTAPGDRAR